VILRYAGVLCAFSFGGVSVTRADSFALIVGVSQYADSEINQLRFADNDAKELAEFLRLYSYYPRDCITLLLNSEATKLRILSSLQELEKRCGPKNGDPGVALVYFAGHAAGTAGSDPDFRKANRSQSREFLVPYDARLAPTYLLPGGGSENTTFL